MNGTAIGEKRRWAAAIIAAAAIMAVVLLLFRFPVAPVVLSPPPTPPVAQPSISLAQAGSADRLLKEQTEISDPRPLFLPTERNATLPEPKRESGRTFLENEMPQLAFAEGELNIIKDLPAAAVLNGKPAEQAKPVDSVASDLPGPPLIGFGRRQTAVEPLRQRGGYVEVISMATGASVWAEALNVQARPPTDKPWSPLELLANVNAAGLVGPLVITEGSRVEEVDAYFRNFLARTYRIGERLPPGFYRVIVAP